MNIISSTTANDVNVVCLSPLPKRRNFYVVESQNTRFPKNRTIIFLRKRKQTILQKLNFDLTDFLTYPLLLKCTLVRITKVRFLLTF